MLFDRERIRSLSPEEAVRVYNRMYMMHIGGRTKGEKSWRSGLSDLAELLEITSPILGRELSKRLEEAQQTIEYPELAEVVNYIARSCHDAVSEILRRKTQTKVEDNFSTLVKSFHEKMMELKRYYPYWRNSDFYTGKVK